MNSFLRPSHWSVVLTLVSASFVSVFAADPPKPLHDLLVIGGGYHDYARQKDILKAGIEERAYVDVELAYVPAANTEERAQFEIFSKPDWAKPYDIIIHDECSAGITNLEYIAKILEPHKTGLPAVFLHCAMHSYRSAGWVANAPSMTPWFELTGLQTTGHGAQRPIELTMLDDQNPITKGMTNWTTVNEELYNNIARKLLDTATPMIRGKQGTSETVVAWGNLYNGKAKVFGTTIGHNNMTVSDPRYLDLVTRGLLWAAGKLEPAYLKPAPKATGSIDLLPTDSEIAALLTKDTLALLAEQSDAECGCQ